MSAAQTSALDDTTTQNKVTDFVKAIIRDSFTKSLFKYGTYSIAGDLTPASSVDKSPLDSIAEYALNMPDQARLTLQRLERV